MERSFGICTLSVVPLRAEPSDRSEMISQLLYGDAIEILERQEKWIKVRNAYDDYQGWMDPKQIDEVGEPEFRAISETKVVSGLQICHPALNLGTSEVSYLVPGSTLPNFEGTSFGVGTTKFQLQGVAVRTDVAKFASEIEGVARFYLNSPYLWGGRSPFGIDCSGFTQIAFKQFGLPLKRDAWEQALSGKLVAFLQEAGTGDLAFFDNEEGRITHVGIMLGNSSIIHASGKVRIDPIDDQGIFNKALGRYTHKLRVIKRYV